MILIDWKCCGFHEQIMHDSRSTTITFWQRCKRCETEHQVEVDKSDEKFIKVRIDDAPTFDGSG